MLYIARLLGNCQRRRIFLFPSRAFFHAQSVFPISLEGGGAKRYSDVVWGICPFIAPPLILRSDAVSFPTPSSLSKMPLRRYREKTGDNREKCRYTGILNGGILS